MTAVLLFLSGQNPASAGGCMQGASKTATGSFPFLPVIFLAVATVATWWEVVYYYFPSEDALGFLPWLKLEKLSDIARVLFGSTTHEKLHGVHALFRPVPALTLSVEYSLYGLNPFGYHVTDLFLHWACSLVVFFLILRLRPSAKTAALIGGLFFVVHPLHIETVPVSVRRSELFLGLFMGLSILFFIRHMRKTDGRRRRAFSTPYILSILSAILAFGSKETAIALPGLVFAFSFCLTENHTCSLRQRTVRALQHALPFLVVSVAFFAVRWMVLGGIGGYAAKLDMSFSKRLVQGAAAIYYMSTRFVIPFLPLGPSTSEYVIEYTLLLSTGFLVFGGLSAYFIYSHRASIGEALARPGEALQKGPVGVYLALIGSLVVLLCPYALLATISPWYSYVPVMFLAVLCSLALMDAYRYLAQQPWMHSGLDFDVFFKSVASSAFLAYFLAILLFSPLFTRSYRDWKTATEISLDALLKTESQIAHLPMNSLFYLLNYPIILANHVSDWNHVRSTALLCDYTVQGYFELKYPEKGFRFKGLCFTSLSALPSHLSLTTDFTQFPSITASIHGGGILAIPRFNVESTFRERATGKWFDVSAEAEDPNLPRSFRPFTRLTVRMKPAGLEGENSYFLVYDGTRVQLYATEELKQGAN